nr:SPFH domain-containing protein [Bifidobacterium callitrichos]
MVIGEMFGTTALILVLVVIILALLISAIFIVPQQQAFIIERFGKFQSVQFAGIHMRIPIVDRIAMKTNMRVNQLNVQLETKTLDNVFVTVVASTQFRVNPENVATAYYELRDPAGQLRSYMEDALRSAIPALTLDDAFARKDDVAFDVQKTVGNEMSRFGFTVVKTLITAIDPSPQVKNAMDSINAAQREKEATRQRAEAQRIQIETQAAAEAEKTRLQGEGQANYRREIANGIVDQIKSLQAVGMNINDVNNVVLFNQYLDVMRSLSESKNAKTVVLPASTPGGYQDLYEQVTKAMLTAAETQSGSDVPGSGASTAGAHAR